MKILQVHNFYREPGGEDQVFAAERELLVRGGHCVIRYVVHNDDIPDKASLRQAFEVVWHEKSHRDIKDLIRRERPAVVHAHNTFPIVSPAIYYSAQSEGVPVVQTLHNYRLVCPAATLFRSGKSCEDCVGKVPYRSVIHACYRESRAATAVVATMLTTHRIAATWERKVDCYVALTAFSREKFIAGGLPPERVMVKPNFLLDDPGESRNVRTHALYVGRLSEGKGVLTLLKAWEGLTEYPLKVVGDGPLREQVASAAAALPSVTCLGRCPTPQVLELMKSAGFVVIPSVAHEQFPITFAEAMACGTPVIASDLGSLRELVKEGVNGSRFRAGDAVDLFRVVKRFLAEPAEASRMQRGARREYEKHYTADANFRTLMSIYEQAISDER